MEVGKREKGVSENDDGSAYKVQSKLTKLTYDTSLESFSFATEEEDRKERREGSKKEDARLERRGKTSSLSSLHDTILSKKKGGGSFLHIHTSTYNRAYGD